MQHQGCDVVVERAITERQRVTKVGHPQVNAVAEPPGQRDHPGAHIEAGHDGTSGAQRLEQRAGTAAGVQDPRAGHLARQRQDRRPLVVDVYDAGIAFGRLRLREAVTVADPRGIGGKIAVRSQGPPRRDGLGIGNHVELCLDLTGTVDIGSVLDGHDVNATGLVVNAVDNPVVTTPRAVQPV